VNSAGVSDTLSATPFGTLNATLGGTLRAVVQPGLYGSSTIYAGVVTATDPITTTFAQTTTSSAFFTATATYNPNSVDLTLNRLSFGSVPGATQNQRNVGNYLEQNYSTGLTGNAAIFFTALLQSPSLGVLDQLSGSGLTGAQQGAFNAGSMFNKAIMDQVWTWLDGGGLGTNDFNPESTLLRYAASEKPARPEYQGLCGDPPGERCIPAAALAHLGDRLRRLPVVARRCRRRQLRRQQPHGRRRRRLRRSGGATEQQIGADLIVEASGGADRAVAGVEAADDGIAAQRLGAAEAGRPGAPALRPECTALRADRRKGLVFRPGRLLARGVSQQGALRIEVVRPEPAAVEPGPHLIHDRLVEHAAGVERALCAPVSPEPDSWSSTPREGDCSSAVKKIAALPVRPVE